MTKKFTLEVIAPTVDEAIEKGLLDLGVSREAVDVEVLDEGTKGLFGLGNRDARIRLTVLNQSDDSDSATEGPEATSPLASEVADAATEPELYEEEDNTLAITRETVAELLEKMDVRAEVTTHYGVDEDGRGSLPIHVDIQGNDLSILIGRGAKTLLDLELITRLIVSKELGQSTLVLVDVEGYRDRRKAQLQRLANKMASQAVDTGRRQVLEPMAPWERRIIHIELRENDEVDTQSVGDDPRRKVTIIPRI